MRSRCRLVRLPCCLTCALRWPVDRQHRRRRVWPRAASYVRAVVWSVCCAGQRVAMRLAPTPAHMCRVAPAATLTRRRACFLPPMSPCIAIHRRCLRVCAALPRRSAASTFICGCSPPCRHHHSVCSACCSAPCMPSSCLAPPPQVVSPTRRRKSPLFNILNFAFHHFTLILSTFHL